MADSPTQCPVCGTSLAPSAVLCVACGYHLVLGHHLGTVVDRPEPEVLAVDANPYAAPAAPDTVRRPRAPVESDLTEAGARRAEAVVSAAQGVFWLMLFAWCLCTPAWLVLFPWYSYRLICWYQLNAQFAELRFPNSFSPHGDLAGKFEEARRPLLIGVVIGAIFWLIMALGAVISLIPSTAPGGR